VKIIDTGPFKNPRRISKNIAKFDLHNGYDPGMIARDSATT
jgi:hypothetical protein